MRDLSRDSNSDRKVIFNRYMLHFSEMEPLSSPGPAFLVVTGTQMKRPTTRILFFACLSMIWLFSNASPSRAENPEASSSQDAGFQAVIAGSYEGKVSGIRAAIVEPVQHA
jgi:hypothetical protein